jgi:tubulin beta
VSEEHGVEDGSLKETAP